MPDVTILPDGIHATADQDETLLRALGRAGLRYRVGCRRGGCGICKVRLVLGEVRYERPIAPACSPMTNGWKASASVAGQCRSPTSSSNFRKETVCEEFWDLPTRRRHRFDHGRSAAGIAVSNETQTIEGKE